MTRQQILVLQRKLGIGAMIGSVILVFAFPLAHLDLALIAGVILLVVNAIIVIIATRRLRALLVPHPPEHVTVDIGGRPVPVDCAYVGFDGNWHTWVVVTAFSPEDAKNITAISVDALPPYTAIALRQRQTP